jgi:hypothetical protein
MKMQMQLRGLFLIVLGFDYMRSAGNLPEAKRKLIAILDLDPNAEASINGNSEAVICWFDASMRESPDDPVFYINKSDCYRAVKKNQTALANFHIPIEYGASGIPSEQSH